MDKPSYGCFYNSGELKHFKRVTMAPTNSQNPINFMVRYSDDPWLGYMRVTSGSGSFGMA